MVSRNRPRFVLMDPSRLPRLHAGVAPQGEDRSEMAEERVQTTVRHHYWTASRGYWVMLAVPLLLLGVFFVWPIAAVILRSFTDPALTTDNYVEIFSRPAYLNVLRNTLEVATTVTVLCLIISYPVAADRRGPQGLAPEPVLRSHPHSVLDLDGHPDLCLDGALPAQGRAEQRPAICRHHRPAARVHAQFHRRADRHGARPAAVHDPAAARHDTQHRSGLHARRRRARRQSARAFLHVYLPLSMPGISAGVMLVFITALGFFITPALLGERKQ